MDPNELQARSVALEELCKQPEKDGPHLLVLEHKHVIHQKAMLQMTNMYFTYATPVLFAFRVIGYCQ